MTYSCFTKLDWPWKLDVVTSAADSNIRMSLTCSIFPAKQFRCVADLFQRRLRITVFVGSSVLSAMATSGKQLRMWLSSSSCSSSSSSDVFCLLRVRNDLRWDRTAAARPCNNGLCCGSSEIRIIRWPVGASARVKIYYLWPRDNYLWARDNKFFTRTGSYGPP